ncbi:uncharacterized protein HMPREF1120_03168 [Exophiala dermatitidis NIH/UT8656]|uniref:Uncharacterized protein n=1 Tax=Exophiala dermatitidis (strain ATCC 34100 / CBS 525.76 / NIH/UT8656) TaxID=858893 RepID=H6BV96_EXODN|nr:uncharacterized protein HMPREF1120_03168 [Exophiala dermatitidis NIH/UT8656]EHY55010.1 hypothetical protein HMPREF1120_03168 [Exophiala dermatitidis NIH/UT8656]
MLLKETMHGVRASKPLSDPAWPKREARFARLVLGVSGSLSSRAPVLDCRFKARTSSCCRRCPPFLGPPPINGWKSPSVHTSFAHWHPQRWDQLRVTASERLSPSPRLFWLRELTDPQRDHLDPCSTTILASKLHCNGRIIEGTTGTLSTGWVKTL